MRLIFLVPILLAILSPSVWAASPKAVQLSLKREGTQLYLVKNNARLLLPMIGDGTSSPKDRQFLLPNGTSITVPGASDGIVGIQSKDGRKSEISLPLTVQ